MRRIPAVRGDGRDRLFIVTSGHSRDDPCLSLKLTVCISIGLPSLRGGLGVLGRLHASRLSGMLAIEPPNLTRGLNTILPALLTAMSGHAGAFGRGALNAFQPV